MNKLFVLPLAFMFLVSIFVFLSTAVEPTGTNPDFTDSGEIRINETGTDSTGKINIPSGGSQTFNLWAVGGMMILLIAAIALGTVASIGIFGSGLGSLGQNLIFQSTLFLGMWSCLTIISAELMFDNVIMTLIYMVMTLMFIVGFGMNVSGGNDE